MEEVRAFVDVVAKHFVVVAAVLWLFLLNAT